MKQIKLLIYILALGALFSSCHETKTYHFNVVNLNGAKEVIIEFKINLGFRERKLKINLIDQNEITLKESDRIWGNTIFGRNEIFFYPSIYQIEHSETIEAIVYNKPWVEKEGQIYKITPCENVNEYFLYLLLDEKIARIVSNEPIINVDELDRSNIVLTYITDPPEIFLKAITNEKIMGGYIIKSNIDGSLLLLD